MSRPWRFTPLDPARVRALCDSLGIAPLTAQVLIARGLGEPAAARAFLSPGPGDLHDPDALPGAADAADRLAAAVRAGRRVTIYGDYDVDGVTATAILVDLLRRAGAEVDFRIPSRLTEGYGLNRSALEELHAADADQLVVTVDCGIASVAEAARAAELGLELVVTDHHTPGDDLPAAAAIVHPRLPGSDYPFGELCGAAVALKLGAATAKRLLAGGGNPRLAGRLRDWFKRAVGLAAVGTVADCVPLTGENRVLVQTGLRGLFHHAPPGLRALLDSCGAGEGEPLSAESIGFQIGPRLNAAGRMGQATLALELLLTEDPGRISKLVALLNDLNATRQKVERETVKEAKRQAKARGWADRGGLVLCSKDWHPGVVGIVAGRVADHFKTPAVLLAPKGTAAGLWGGSGRSHAGFDLFASLTRCGEWLTTFGGHPAAAGVSLTDANLDAFREAFAADVAERHHPTAADLELRVDAEVRLADCTLAAVKELEAKLGPFGQANPRPVFVAAGVDLAGEPRTMGQEGKHLSARFTQSGRTLRAVAWGRGAEAGTLAGEPLALSFTTEVNRWQGREEVQLHLREWKPAAELG